MPNLSPLPPQLQRKSLGDQVYETIRESIVSLRLEPGSMIYENELSETLHVSRTPIREAIRLLVSEQLLEVLPQRGTRISPISERKVNEARFIREHLELGAFKLAARMWGLQDRQAERAKLDQLLAGQQEAGAAGDIELFLQHDEAFHRTIMEVTGNVTLMQVINHMRGHLNRLRYLALKEFHYLDQVIQEHKDLIAAIDQGDEALAGSRLERHIGKLDNEMPALRQMFPHFFTD
ncbi:GntR family transcriptional regulator [Paenibacillus hexagrammi]|uniref:GntR family transcriptional regulator n=1 Tax=Paenibacillus hexagrammi TaxID=2908839 RepID=A0ABY3SHX4_9BACL|nr:GntR family transcriptional regulator [Paenibacillus sp. YPD9-1]UJF32826.1 GntR family transcriptional regulator [Paenibacillus sp. YPD9-1]